MVDRLLEAEESAVGDKDPEVGVGQKVVLRQPLAHHHIGGKIFREVVRVKLPDDGALYSTDFPSIITETNLGDFKYLQLLERLSEHALLVLSHSAGPHT